MTGIFGYRIGYDDGTSFHVPFLPSSLAGAVEVEPVVFVAAESFYIDDTFPATLVVRRVAAPDESWWPLDKAIQLGLASTRKEWTSEVPGQPV